jgi:hypothetical protein
LRDALSIRNDDRDDTRAVGVDVGTVEAQSDPPPPDPPLTSSSYFSACTSWRRYNRSSSSGAFDSVSMA